MPTQPQDPIRTDVSRYCPKCNGLDAKTSAPSREDDGTLRYARSCPCGHRWIDVVQGGPFLQHVRP